MAPAIKRYLRDVSLCGIPFRNMYNVGRQKTLIHASEHLFRAHSQEY